MEVLAACHIHSSWSYDGSWSIEDLAATFAKRGYRVMMMTEHDRGFTPKRFQEFRDACAKATTEDMFVLPGIEYSDPDNRIHVLVWGPVPFLGENLKTDDMLEAVAQAQGVAVWAHPARRDAWQCFKPEWSERLLGIEAWNRKYDGWAPSDAGARLLLQAPQVPFVGLDFHSSRQLFPLGMALEVGASIDEQAIVASLKGRRCAARAFGGPLDQARFQSRLPLLRVAERGRKKLAALKRASTRRLRG